MWPCGIVEGMRIVIAGGHGQIALLLTRRLAARGDTGVGLIRNPDHEAEVVAAGGEAAVFDLESGTVEQLTDIVRGADAVVFAAGAGPDSSAERKLTVDRDAAIALRDAAAAAGVSRYVLVSAIAADDFDRDSDEIYQVYLRAKSDADAAVRRSDLDWTIVRPGGLTNDAAHGRVRIAESTGRGTISRDDVAAVLLAVLDEPTTVGRQFEVISGDTPISEALAV